MDSNNPNGFYRISARTWVAGVAFKEGVVVDAPPIAKWAKGKTLEEVTKLAAEKDAMVEEIVQQRGRKRKGIL